MSHLSNVNKNETSDGILALSDPRKVGGANGFVFQDGIRRG